MSIIADIGKIEKLAKKVRDTVDRLMANAATLAFIKRKLAQAKRRGADAVLTSEEASALLDFFLLYRQAKELTDKIRRIF